LSRYNFVYNKNKNENSIDSFVISLWKGYDNNYSKNIISYINPNFWDNFAIKYASSNGQLSIVKRLLLHDMVEPGADNNKSLRVAIVHHHYRIANELLKHPLVIVDHITSQFVNDLISSNWLCVSEKILRLGNNNIIDIFKRSSVIDLIIFYHNDVTYLAIKLGILSVDKLINHYPEKKITIKKYLAKFKLDDEYVHKPYEFNLDPENIFKIAIKSDDIDLAKSIKNYSISIGNSCLLNYLGGNGYEPISNTVSEYIYDYVITTYDPDYILRHAAYFKLFEKIFKIITNNDLDFNCELLYRHQASNNKNIILKYIKAKYSAKDYKKFLKDNEL
jgi:hypothetical protein